MKAKISTMMMWVGPAAILGAAFYVVSDQLGLVTHFPGLGDDASGYHAVGSGLFLLIFTLLLVGMFGLYARRSDPDGPTVIEYGDASARYVLVTEPEEGTLAPDSIQRGPEARHHRMKRATGQRVSRNSGSARSKSR